MQAENSPTPPAPGQPWRAPQPARPPGFKAIQEANARLGDPAVHEVVPATASDVFVVRGLNEARTRREIALGDLREIELRRVDRRCFEREEPCLHLTLEAAKAAGFPPATSP